MKINLKVFGKKKIKMKENTLKKKVNIIIV
jgi:hypothetical protein